MQSEVEKWPSLLRERIGSEFDNECHLSGDEATELASLIERLYREREKLRKALGASMTALDDWLNVYASEFCDEDRVKEAGDRIAQYGTISYIAHVQEANRNALAEQPQ